MRFPSCTACIYPTAIPRSSSCILQRLISMPSARPEAPRSHRKGQYSCEFCRARKLRCDRPLPCTNCVSRGKTCHFGPLPGQRPSTLADHQLPGQHQQQHQQQQHEQQPVTAPLVSPVTGRTNTGAPTSSSDQPPSLPATTTTHFVPPTALGQTQLLKEVQSLRRLAADLERRVALSTSTSTAHQDEHHPSPSPRTHIDVGQSGSPSSSESPRLDQVKDVVAHLERVSMVQSSRVRNKQPEFRLPGTRPIMADNYCNRNHQFTLMTSCFSSNAFGISQVLRASQCGMVNRRVVYGCHSTTRLGSF